MPIEINELHIKVTVNKPPAADNAAAGTSATAAAPGGDDKEMLVNHCIEEVMTILNRKKER